MAFEIMWKFHDVKHNLQRFFTQKTELSSLSFRKFDKNAFCRSRSDNPRIAHKYVAFEKNLNFVAP